MPHNHTVGICSWCLGTDDVATMFATAREKLGVDTVQFGLFGSAAVEAADPELIRRAARDQGITLSACFVLFDDENYSSIDAIGRTGGFGPADPFAVRLALIERGGAITQALGLGKLSIHGGAIPETADDPRFAAMVERFQIAADRLACCDVRLLLETGQESAGAMLRLLRSADRPNLGVNFDSGNFIMYGTDSPAAAAQVLAPHVEHVHLKDATRSETPGESWGTEVALGAGDADVAAVVRALGSGGYTGPLVVERSRRRTLDEVGDSLTALRAMLA